MHASRPYVCRKARLRKLGAAPVHGRIDDPGTKKVHANAFGSQLGGDTARQANQPVLRGRLYTA